jgi:hypothetical protein
MLPSDPILLSEKEVARLIEDGDRRAFVWKCGACNFVCFGAGIVVFRCVGHFFFRQALTFTGVESDGFTLLMVSLIGFGAGWLMWKAGFHPRRPRNVPNPHHS